MTALVLPRQSLRESIRDYLYRLVTVVRPSYQTSGVIVSDGIEFKTTPPASAGASIWWTNNGTIPAPIAAYRAVGTPSSPWGVGPATLAESYVNLANPGTYNLTVGTAPTLSVSGWYSDGTKYLLTGITPTNDYTIMIHAIGEIAPGSGITGYMIGSSTNNYGIIPASANAGTYFAKNGSFYLVGFGPYQGTYAIAKNKSYINGIFDRDLVTSLTTNALSLFSNGAGSSLGKGYLKSVWIANYDASAYISTLNTILGQL